VLKWVELDGIHQIEWHGFNGSRQLEEKKKSAWIQGTSYEIILWLADIQI